MPIRYVVLPSGGLLYGVGSGPIGNADLRTLMEQVRSDPLFDQTRSELWDFTGCLPAGVSFDGLFGVVRAAGALMKHRPRPGPKVRCAIVVATEEQFGLARMYQSLSEWLRTETEVFQSRGEAEQWLGIEAELLRPAVDLLTAPPARPGV